MGPTIFVRKESSLEVIQTPRDVMMLQQAITFGETQPTRSCYTLGVARKA